MMIDGGTGGEFGFAFAVFGFCFLLVVASRGEGGKGKWWCERGTSRWRSKWASRRVPPVSLLAGLAVRCGDPGRRGGGEAGRPLFDLDYILLCGTP